MNLRHMSLRRTRRSTTDKVYELWVEGFAATGEHGTAMYLGDWSGGTFQEAVQRWNDTDNADGGFGELEIMPNGTCKVWGCRIFSNRLDAQRSFG